MYLVHPVVQEVEEHTITEPAVQEILHQFRHLKVIMVLLQHQEQVQHRAMLLAVAVELQQLEFQAPQDTKAEQVRQVQFQVRQLQELAAVVEQIDVVVTHLTQMAAQAVEAEVVMVQDQIHVFKVPVKQAQPIQVAVAEVVKQILQLLQTDHMVVQVQAVQAL